MIIGNDANADSIGNETLEPRTNVRVDNFGRSSVGEDSASHDQVFERDIVEKIRKEVDNAVTSVEKWVHDSSLAAMDNAFLPRVK